MVNVSFILDTSEILHKVYKETPFRYFAHFNANSKITCGNYMDYKRLGDRIREERLRLNLTQADLAEAIADGNKCVAGYIFPL